MLERKDEPQFEALRVLVVEDSGLSYALIEVMLECLTGATPDRAVNGKEAVQCVQSKDYDLVIMDHMMPVMSGEEATREIRQCLPAWKQPVIAGLSGATSQADLRCYREAGMDYFLAKPMRLADLRSLLGQVVGREHRAYSWNSMRVGSALVPAGMG